MRRIGAVSLMLVVAMLYSTVIGGFSKTGRFTDVPSSHWGASYIDALADGGLVQGYGNNRFGPNDDVAIDQVATIICNAKGHSTETTESYWGYEAVRYCRDELRCLPNLGEINHANYSVACTR